MIIRFLIGLISIVVILAAILLVCCIFYYIIKKFKEYKMGEVICKIFDIIFNVILAIIGIFVMIGLLYQLGDAVLKLF